GGRGNAAAPPPQEIGGPLYTGTTLPPATAVPNVVESIVIPNAVVQNDLRVQVPAQGDGLIELIATPLEPGEACDPTLVVYHPRDQEKDPTKRQRYRRIRENDSVKSGQILARLDEQLVQLQIQANISLEKAMTLAIKEAKDAVAAQEEAAAL